MVPFTNMFCMIKLNCAPIASGYIERQRDWDGA